MTPFDVCEFVNLRRDLHAHPELGLEEHRTSAIVAERLAALGWRVTTGIGKTGVVGTLTAGSSRRAIGIRADMDALPIHETTGLAYASRNVGRMHACGHDGHTATLLAAAARLAASRAFDGTVHLIFQPAEENVGGGQMMVEDGLFDRFPCDAIFAMHNYPGVPLGHFGFRAGPIMAAVDEATIIVQGQGGHGADPHEAIDPIVAGASIVMALQTIISRNRDPIDPGVITVGAFQSGQASNVIPDTARLVLSIRSFDPDLRDQLEARIKALVAAQAASFGASATVDYLRSYPATINHADETAFARSVAVAHAGDDKVYDLRKPSMGSEDFSYMLEKCPGSYFTLGAGDAPGWKSLHHPSYDFNDDLIAIGSGYWQALAERFLAPA